jgi:hypothetical protein
VQELPFKGLVDSSKLYDLIVLLRLQPFSLPGGAFPRLCLIRDFLLLDFVVCFVKVLISLLHYLLHLYVRLGRLLQSGIIDRVGIDGARGAGVPRIALTCVSFLAQRHAGRNHERQGQP